MQKGMIERLFANTVYVKVYPNRFELRQIESGKSVSAMPTTPFTTDRLLVGQFVEADKTLRKGMRRLQEGKWFFQRPVVVIQPMEKTEGGLSQLEEGVLDAIAAGAGARKVVVWVGHELTDEEVLSKSKAVRRRDKKAETNTDLAREPFSVFFKEAVLRTPQGLIFLAGTIFYLVLAALSCINLSLVGLPEGSLSIHLTLFVLWPILLFVVFVSISSSDFHPSWVDTIIIAIATFWPLSWVYG